MLMFFFPEISRPKVLRAPNKTGGRLVEEEFLPKKTENGGRKLKVPTKCGAIYITRECNRKDNI